MASTKLSRYNSRSNKSHHGDFTIDTGAHQEQPVPTPDIIFENYGSLFLLRPVSAAGQTWLDENISDGALTIGGAIVCEIRYVEDIILGAIDDGLVCR
jgi:hypothetical protein